LGLVSKKKKKGVRLWSFFLLPLVERAGFGTIAAARHVAPAPAVILARIEKEPLARFRGARPHEGQLI
jgi:hypothetical protein